MAANLTRRRTLLGLGATLVLGGAAAARRLLPTPAQTAGPFYPQQPPLDDDNDLTRVKGRGGIARGEVTDLTGRVVDPGGQPLRGARIEIWQCDANGRYHHPRDRGGVDIDADFQGFGHTYAGDDGSYLFRTIRPVPYPGRTPHIHMAVFPRGASPFVTQLYVQDEPRNADDFLFTRVPAERRHLVLAEFVPTAGGAAAFSARFDIVIAGTDGTPGAGSAR